jgi:hypothetical protein
MILAAQDIVSTLVRAGPKDPTTRLGYFGTWSSPLTKGKLKAA